MRRRSFAIQSGNSSETSDARDAGAGETSPVISASLRHPRLTLEEDDRDELGSSCRGIDERFDSDRRLQTDAAGSRERGAGGGTSVLTRLRVHQIRRPVRCRSNKQKNKFIKKTSSVTSSKRNEIESGAMPIARTQWRNGVSALSHD